MKGKVFISYRREDARADARSLYQRLELTFGSGQLFMDVDSIPTGSEFRRVLDRQLKQCEVMLVIIGRDWLDCRDERGRRRLDDPNDFVRLEVGMALKRRIAVIPVLVDGTALPRAEEVPNELRPLIERQAAGIRHEAFARDVDALVGVIRAIFNRHRARRLQVSVGAAGGVVLAGLAVVFWPQVGPLLGFGVANVNLVSWQRDVQPAIFKIEESRNIGGLKAVADRVKEVSNGKLELSVVSAGSLVKPADRLDALSNGTLDAVWESPAAWSLRFKTLALHGGQVPRGLEPKRFAAWVRERGARELDAIYRDRLGLKVKSVPCRVFGTEGIWFKTPVIVPRDLVGSRIRSASSLMMLIAPKLALKTVTLPASKILIALERGELDAAEYGNPPSDYELGLYKAARHFYYPGFHAPALAGHVMFNLDKWNAFSVATRGLIEEACRVQIDVDLKSEADNVKRALGRLKLQGVQVHTFSSSILSAVDQAVREVVDELSASDADFKRAYASYNAFR